MDKQFYKKLLEKVIIASKTNPKYINTKDFLKFRIIEIREKIEEFDNFQ